MTEGKVEKMLFIKEIIKMISIGYTSQVGYIEIEVTSLPKLVSNKESLLI
jgi:hypothetical protein|tara:strand:- start:1021 stop:1170 length:150 start_codon:yes stop_codon:yes gene_type:complete